MEQQDRNDPVTLDCSVWTASGLTFLLGVHWWYAESEASAKAMKSSLVKDGEIPKGAKFRIMRNADDDSWLLGAWVGKAHYLASPLMALVIRSGIFVQQLDGDRVWMMAASNGCILPGHDLVTSASEKSRLLGEWYSVLPDATIYGDESGAQQSASDCWRMLIEGIENAEHNPAVLKASRVSRPVKMATVAAVGVLVALLAGIGFMGVSLLGRDSNQPAVLDLSFIETQRQAQEAAARQARLQARFEQAVQSMLQKNSQPSGVAQALDVIDTLNQMRFDKGSKRLLSIDCQRQDASVAAAPPAAPPAATDAATDAEAPTGLQTGSIWSCTPTWRADAAAGLLSQAPLRPEVPVIGQVEVGFVGTPIRIHVEQRPQAFVALHDSAWWLHAIHDQMLAAGVQVSTAEISVGADGGAGGGSAPAGTGGSADASVFALGAQENLSVLSSAFQEEGFALENIPDRHLGTIVRAQWSTSLARIDNSRENSQWRAFMSQWPMQVERIHINERGAVVLNLGIARLNSLAAGAAQ